MQKHFSLKHWRISAGVVLTALAIIASASQSFAQQPGESNFYTLKQVQKTGNLHAEGSLAETRNGTNILDAWKANDSTNQVWLSFNNGTPFTVSSTTKTFVSPAVVAFGPTNFLVFHTGIDGQIWYAAVAGTNNTTGWIPVPGQTSNMSVSVAQIGRNSANVFMVYRGSGNDTRVFGTWLNAQQEWSSPTNIGGGRAVTASAICLNNTGSSLWVATIGTDNQLWTTSQPLGAPNWANWTPRGVFTGPNSQNGGGAISAPSCAATDNGNVMVDYVDSNGRPHYTVFNNGGSRITNWTEDLVSAQKGWVTVQAVNLTSSGNTVWSLFTGLTSICTGNAQSIGMCDPTGAAGNQVWWKTATVQ